MEHDRKRITKRNKKISHREVQPKLNRIQSIEISLKTESSKFAFIIN